jgi:SAM-dependent methyltransferase
MMQPTRESRHQRVEDRVAREIAGTIRELASDRSRLLHIQPFESSQTLAFHAQLRAGERPVIYAEKDERPGQIRATTDFVKIDIERASFPAASEYFDVVVWNRELVTVKNILPALLEVRRVLRPGGILLLAVPNLAALHNRILLAVGRQPTTLHVGNGDHLRGFVIASMTQFLRADLGLDVLQITGIGLAPLTAASMPRPLRGVSHSVLWALRKPTMGGSS